MKSFKQYLNEKKEKMRVVYHNDMDGFGSAYAIWKKLKENATYASLDNSQVPIVKSGELVYMVDVTVKRPVMIKLAN